MNSNIKLTTDDILKKQFSIVRKGYSADEVNQFLDIVINDYQEFQDEIESLKKQLAEKSSTMANLDVPESTNFDILRRLSKLESKVYQLEKANNPMKDDEY